MNGYQRLALAIAAIATIVASVFGGAETWTKAIPQIIAALLTLVGSYGLRAPGAPK